MDIEDIVYLARGRIIVTHERDWQAVHIRFMQTHDGFGVFLPAAVRAGLAYASDHEVPNWVVDVVDEVDSMSETDAEWENSEDFRDLFRSSTIRNILLVVPAPESGADLAGELAWVTGLAEQLGSDFTGAVVGGRDGIAEQLGGRS